MSDKNDLFKADRRNEERENASDRRIMYRPSVKLRIIGGIVALFVTAVLFAIAYFMMKP